MDMVRMPCVVRVVGVVGAVCVVCVVCMVGVVCVVGAPWTCRPPRRRRESCAVW